jgi:membrane-associated phospholipid phosphatase
MPRRAVLALAGAGAGIALLVLTWFLAFHVGVFQRADQTLLKDFRGFSFRPHVEPVASFIARLCNPQPYVWLAAVPVGVALWRRRGWLTVTIATVLLGANVTTHLLKPLLAQPRAASLFGGYPPVGPVSWPSGHATAAMSLALCCVLAAPARLRPVVAAAGAAFAVAVSYSFLSLGWHYPSDVFGGFLVAGTWALVGMGAMYIVGGRRAGRTAEAPLTAREALAAPATALLSAIVLGGLVALARPHQVITYARVHRVFVIGAAAIALLALALATGLTLALRVRPRDVRRG